MNILVFSMVDKNNPSEAGVFKKICGEADAFKNRGFEAYLGYICDNSYIIENRLDKVQIRVSIEGLKRYKRNRVIYDFALKAISENEIKVVYARLGVCSIQTAIFYRNIKKCGSKLLVEIPSWPIKQRWASFFSELKAGRVKCALHMLYNNTINSAGILFFHQSVDRIVIIGLEIPKIWKIPTITISNGIDTDMIPIKKVKADEENAVDLICVANLSVWHGLDKAIKGLYNYRKENGKTPVRLSVVGAGSDAARLKQLVERLDLADCVFFKGFKKGEDLDKEFDDADLAISVLGADKGHLIVSDSLKSKEYCARGIPFVTGTMETKYNDLPFVYQIKESEDSLCIDDVLAFYQLVKSIPELSSMIRQYSYDNCDWRVTFENVIRFCRDES